MEATFTNVLISFIITVTREQLETGRIYGGQWFEEIKSIKAETAWQQEQHVAADHIENTERGMLVSH